MPPPSWTPSVDDVGAILYARTRDNNGNEVGTFTGGTRPTTDEVQNIITDAVRDVLDAVGQAIPSDMWDSARTIAALGTALTVELSYFPEQVGMGRSPYNQLKKLYDDRLARLVLQVEAEGADVPGSEYMHPAGAFGGNPVPIAWWSEW